MINTPPLFHQSYPLKLANALDAVKSTQKILTFVISAKS